MKSNLDKELCFHYSLLSGTKIADDRETSEGRSTTNMEHPLEMWFGKSGNT